MVFHSRLKAVWAKWRRVAKLFAMRFTFLGHAAFLIETDGQRIITDPYSSEIGYAPISESADVVTLSHDNPKWHSCLDDIRGEFETVHGLEIVGSSVRHGEVTFGAVEVFENPPDDGPNAMIWLESEGLRVLHTGDCGFLPDDQTLQKCGRVDVLLALAGGPPTLELEDLVRLIDKLQPRIVIPMHFGVPGLAMNALPVEELEKRFESSKVVRPEGSSLEITRENLPPATQLQILIPARQREYQPQ